MGLEFSFIYVLSITNKQLLVEYDFTFYAFAKA